MVLRRCVCFGVVLWFGDVTLKTGEAEVKE